MSMRPVAALAVVATLLCSAQAMASGRQNPLTLEEVVARSNLIVIAKPAKPPMRIEEVAVTDGTTKYPPYRRALERWIVRRIIRGRGVTIGATVEIRGAQDGMWLTVYRRRVIEQVNKIVLIDTYQARKSPDGEVERILFVQSDGKTLEFVAEGSVEALSAREEVLKLDSLAKSPPAPL